MDAERFERTITAFDRINNGDPNKESVDGEMYPKELLYAQRMTEHLSTFYPEASEELRLAARAQHIRRWAIPRNDYPMLVKVSDVKRGVEAVEQIWAQILPDVPLDLSFYDDRMNRLYEKETSLSYLISAFSIVAIVLTVMGLYGIIILIVESRLKELGIRKMLGSSVTALIVLVAKKYLLLTLAALFIGLPLSYTVLRFWLESFSYQTSMKPTRKKDFLVAITAARPQSKTGRARRRRGFARGGRR